MAVLGVAATTLAGCSGTSESAEPTATASGSAPSVEYDGPNAGLPAALPKPMNKAVTVGYLQPYSGVSTLMAIQNAMEKAVVGLGGRFIVKDSNLNPQTQVSQMNELISQHVDDIVVFPIDPTSLTPSLARAKGAGIHVIAVSATQGGDEPVPSGYVATIDLCADTAAYETVREVARRHPGAKTVVLGSTLPVPASSTPRCATPTGPSGSG